MEREVTMKFRVLCLLASAVAGSAAGASSQSVATANPPTQASQSSSTKPASASSPQHVDDGQRVFEQNCSRCHTAPEGFSPKISGTIVRHMRARASLSRRDEEAILKFFNP